MLYILIKMSSWRLLIKVMGVWWMILWNFRSNHLRLVIRRLEVVITNRAEIEQTVLTEINTLFPLEK